MARADKSIDPRILKSAREEFLAFGFEKASLKSICEQAEVTTGALYKRYKGKEELFCGVVHQTVEEMEAVLKEHTVDTGTLSDEVLVRAWDMDEPYMLWWFDFLYKRRDDFFLLLTCAAGTRYADFQHDWVEKMTDSSYAYYLEAYKRKLAGADIPRTELHVLLSAFWTTIYEPFIHHFTWEQIVTHSKLVCSLFNWETVMQF